MERKILYFSITILVILSLIPLLWIKGLDFNLAVFTEEWYKTIISILLIILGFFLFDYLIKKSNTDRGYKTIRKFEERLTSSSTSLKESLKGDIEKNNLQIALLHFRTLQKLVTKNPSLTSLLIDLYVILFEPKVDSAFEILLKYCQNETIDASVLKNSIRIVDDYLKKVEDNTTANSGLT